MPLVRAATFAYKDLWNLHTIRKQPNRPNAVSGQPYQLYHYPKPEVKSYGRPINQEFVSDLYKSFDGWGKFLTALSSTPHFYLIKLIVR